MTAWTPASIPDQTGRTIVVTGASSGIGAEAAEVLAGRGANVVLAVRDVARGAAVRDRILKAYPDARLTVARLDVADLASVRTFAAAMAGTLQKIDVLLNNAGLGMQPARAATVDGFERQFGTNHLGHFALTGLLMPLLLKAAAPRVVGISSIAHRTGRIDFADLQHAQKYSGNEAYAQSKLANLLFAFELDRRARAAQAPLVSVAAHPGIAGTGFVTATQMPGFVRAVFGLGVRVVGQDAAHGALPGLYAATMPDVLGGQYWGPDGLMELRGAPALAKVGGNAQDRTVAARLWTVSEDLTGVAYPPLG
ncbi:oxidoreductase [Beijerinckia sp. L45]|uniref:oxidoreductase n=1 Tax=Beijerinckia sp. L45 TaxID=1641855 RepID=UPI00131BBA7A|nr:oxidoreductase [Beijerinckia sp. L45]